MSMGTSDLRIGTSGWNYPSGRGTWNGIFYPPSRGRAKGFDELAFYAEHFNTVEVNSTFYGQPRAEVCRGWAQRTPPGFEFSIKLYQKFTHPKMFKEAFVRGVSRRRKAGRRSLDELARPNQSDLDDVPARASIRWPRAASWARCSRSFPRASRTARRRATTCSGCSQAFAGLPRGRRTAPQQLERRYRRHAVAAQPVRIRLGSDRRAEIQAVDQTELPAERGRALLHAASRPERQGVVDARESRGPLQLPLHRARSQRVRRNPRRRAARW